LAVTFFGLTGEYLEDVYDQIFLLKYYGGWSFFEAYNLPIQLRQWFLKRLVKQKEEEQKSAKQAARK
jgi:hypothetical protein